MRRREAGKPVTSTGELVQLVRDALPAAAKRTGGNPAKRTFQALRIAVNNELEVLSSAIVSAVDVLRVDGRIVVESYQSLEDRIVKQTFAKAASLAAPVDMPVVPDDALPVVETLKNWSTIPAPLQFACVLLVNCVKFPSPNTSPSTQSKGNTGE